MAPLWEVFLKQWGEGPPRPRVGPEGPGLKGFLGWSSQGPFSPISLLLALHSSFQKRLRIQSRVLGDRPTS